MASREFPIVGDSLVLGYRFQRYWDDAMARAFFFGELGAGLFLVGALYNSVICMVVGVCITAILTTYFHLSHMGVPGRSWRAILRPDRSWISRGAISIVLFTGAALLHILLNGFGLAEWLGGGALVNGIAGLVKIASILLALFVMMYHGFAISDSTAISFWNTGLMPISSLAYSALGGMVLSLNLNPAAGAAGARYLPPAHSASLVLVVVAAIIVLALLQGAKRGSPGAKKSLFLLTRDGPYVKWFYGLVIGAGFVLPFLLLALLPESRVISFLVALAVLSGYYTFRVLVFKVGLYDPIISFAPES